MADPMREKPGGDATEMATGNICRVTTGRTTSWTTWRTPESPALAAQAQHHFLLLVLLLVHAR
jgi:hypothetical protein